MGTPTGQHIQYPPAQYQRIELISAARQFQTKGSVIVKKKIYAIALIVCMALLLGTGCSGKQPAETPEE